MGGRSPAVNEYYDAQAPADPLSVAQFEELLTRHATLLGVSTAVESNVAMIRFLLYRKQSNRTLLQLAFQEVLCQCFPYIGTRKEAVTVANTLYAESRFGPHNSDTYASGELAFKNMTASWSTGTKKNAVSYQDEATMIPISVIVEGVKVMYDVTAQHLFDNTRDALGVTPSKAILALRVGLSVQLRRDPKDVHHIFEHYLNTVEKFEHSASLLATIRKEREENGILSFGNHTGLYKGVKWGERLQHWKGEAIDRVPGVTFENIQGLLSRPTSDQANEALRVKFWDFLRKCAVRDSYPRVPTLRRDIYRSYDLHAGSSYRRALTESETTAVLWWVGQEHVRNDGIILASDALSLPYIKVVKFIHSLGTTWKERMEEVCHHFGEEEPDVE